MKKIYLIILTLALVSCQKKNETPETLSPELASYEQKSASDSSNSDKYTELLRLS